MQRQTCKKSAHCSCCGNMRHVPPVIYWVGHRRGPADCAGLGCRCRTVPLWSGSPPVRSQREGRNKQSELLSAKWHLESSSAQNDKLQSLPLPPSSESVVHVCWLAASFCLFPVHSPRLTQIQLSDYSIGRCALTDLTSFLFQDSYAEPRKQSQTETWGCSGRHVMSERKVFGKWKLDNISQYEQSMAVKYNKHKRLNHF